MMNPDNSNSNPHDLEKDHSVASETEGSHTHDGDAAHYSGGEPVVFRQGKEVVSPSPKRPILVFVGFLVAVALVVILPSVLVDRDDNNTTSSSNQAISHQGELTSTAASLKYDSFEYKAEDNEQCPGHLEGEYDEISQVWALGLELGERGTTEDRTFEVEPSHTVLDGAVQFNVETVTEALAQDLAKPILTAQDVQKNVADEASRFYQDATAAMSYPVPPLPNITVEVVSNTDGDELPLVYAGNQGFLAAVMMSFAQHLPLALSPDHLWTIIAQGFARHVDQHAEELRHHFVDHDGTKKIVIREDRMVKGASPPEQWEEFIFPRFSEEIGNNMNNQEAYKTLSDQVFSTSTATSQAASEIVLMAAMKNFFEYTMVTACGIPQIRLEGTREDWVALRDRTEKLAQWMMPGSTHGALWITDIVLPILDQFLQAYDGHINYCFWQTMVKFRNTGGGSGSFDFLSGWLQNLFPYLSMEGSQTKPNPFLKTWEESASALEQGAQPNEVPSQMSSVPVMWQYFSEEYPLHFHAGFRGVTQEADGTLAPVLGWYVTNDPAEE